MVHAVPWRAAQIRILVSDTIGRQYDRPVTEKRKLSKTSTLTEHRTLILLAFQARKHDNEKCLPSYRTQNPLLTADTNMAIVPSGDQLVRERMPVLLCHGIMIFRALSTMLKVLTARTK